MASRAVEAIVLTEPIARQRDRLIGEDRGHEARPGLIGVLGDPTHQWQRHRRRRHQQVLSRLELQPNLDGDFGQTVEFDGIDWCRDVAFMGVH
jgi:hypothetical protein